MFFPYFMDVDENRRIIRAAAGSEDAYIVVLPTFIASVISFVSAAAICALLCRIMPQRPIGKGKA